MLISISKFTQKLNYLLSMAKFLGLEIWQELCDLLF